MTHTPTPWAIDGGDAIVASDGEQTVLWCPPGIYQGKNFRNDLPFIVKAVNSHEALVEALRDAEYVLTNLAEEEGLGDGPCDAEELCGKAVCNRCGCVCDKRDNARRALALTQSNQADGRSE